MEIEMNAQLAKYILSV